MRRPPPASLVWLAWLVAFAIGVAALSGGVLYFETRAATRTRAEAMTGGSANRGREAMVGYGCGGCHVIPGVPDAEGMVGPGLAQIATRAEIAGKLPNDPDAMIRWLMHPQRVSPGTGMPEMGVDARDARDMAAYLYTQD